MPIPDLTAQCSPTYKAGHPWSSGTVVIEQILFSCVLIVRLAIGIDFLRLFFLG
jgi:hypothetical protein